MRDLPAGEHPVIGHILVDRYEVRACIGVGAMGKIYRCYDRVEHREVAVKVLLDALSSDPEVVQRFEREVHTSRTIDHLNVIQNLDSGILQNGQQFLVMELLTGESGRAYLTRCAPLSTEEVFRLGVAIADGLSACHAAGIIHRDLKPSNLSISGACEEVKIFDFGLGLDETQLEPGAERLTALDLRIGTPMYMSPEYIDEGRATASCDLYALGVVLYEAATGHPLFDGAAYEVLHQQVNVPPTPIHDRVPGRHPLALTQIIEGLLHKDPAQRPPSADALATRLRQAETAKPASRASPSQAVVTLFVTFALLWHTIFLVSNLGGKSALIGGDLITSHVAARVAWAGSNPYDPSRLQAAAQGEGIRRSVPALHQPPSHLLLLGASALLPLNTAHAVSIAVNEWLLAGVLFTLAFWWREMGSAVPVVLAATMAALTSIPIHHQAGQYQLLLLALVLLAFLADQEDRRTWAGALLGVACAISLRPALFAVLWLAQRRTRSLFTAAAVFSILQVLSLFVVGAAATGTYWTQIVPDMLTGQFDGALVNVDMASNHAIASRLGIGGAWLCAAVLLGGAASLFRTRSQDPLTNGARAAALGILCVVLPVFGREFHLVWTLPAMAVCVLAVYEGRLSDTWAPCLGVAIAILAYPMKPLLSLHAAVLVPGLPLFAPWLLEIKLIALLALFAFTLAIGRGPPPTVTAAPRTRTG